MITSCSEVRKHISQMSLTEVALLRRYLQLLGTKGLTKTPHCLDREFTKGIRDKSDKLRELLTRGKGYEIVEYKVMFLNGVKHDRVVVRFSYSRTKSILFVLQGSAQGLTVITTWLNRKDDRHITLDMTLYKGGSTLAIGSL